MQTLSGNILSADRPFQGQGVSVYAGTGHAPYRAPRVISGRLTPIRTRFRGTKTLRIASQAATSGAVQITPAVPAALIDNPIAAFDVRHYRDDVECEVDAPQLVSIDSSGDQLEVIDGSALLLATEVRTSGTVVVYFRFFAGTMGPPFRFRLERTAGPTSPADVTTLYVGPNLYEVEIPSLSSGTYMYNLSAENEAETVSLALVTGFQFTLTADGPDAVTGLVVEVR